MLCRPPAHYDCYSQLCLLISMFSCESSTDEINTNKIKTKNKDGGFWIYVHHINQETTELKTTSLLLAVEAMMADHLMGYVVRSWNLLRWTRV